MPHGSRQAHLRGIGTRIKDLVHAYEDEGLGLLQRLHLVGIVTPPVLLQVAFKAFPVACVEPGEQLGLLPFGRKMVISHALQHPEQVQGIHGLAADQFSEITFHLKWKEIDVEGKVTLREIADVFVVDEDSGKLRLVAEDAGHPRWHPAENRILFNRRSSPNRLCTVETDANVPLGVEPPISQVVYVGSGLSYGHPSYSPDGRYLCTDYVKGTPMKDFLYLLDLQDLQSGPKVLCYLPTANGTRDDDGDSCHPHPVWVDDRTLVVNSDHGGGNATDEFGKDPAKVYLVRLPRVPVP